MKIILNELEDFYRKPRNNESLVRALPQNTLRARG
jgi:hypothetical protein